MSNSSCHTEQRLLQLLNEGDKEAFTRLYFLHSAAVYQKLYVLLKSATLAEELLQEIFVLVWERRETIEFHTSFLAYLHKVGRNKVIDMFRHRRRQEAAYRLLGESGDLNQHAEPRLEQDDLQRLRSALEALPPQRKLVFISCKFDGRSYREVSETLGISPATVNDHIVKATKTLRGILARDRDAGILLALLALSFS